MPPRGIKANSASGDFGPWWRDPNTLFALGGVVVAGSAVWGVSGFVLSAAAGAAWIGLKLRQERQHQESLLQQERMALQLMRGADPEELATLVGGSEIGQMALFQFLQDLKASTGGESSRGSTRLPGEQQQEAVAPGILVNLTHDLGIWYARLELKGDAAKAFLKGQPCTWRGRGKTPDEAFQAAIAAAGQAHKRMLIAEFAETLAE